MLSDDEMRDIRAEMEHYPDRRAIGLEAMKIVQHHRGWVSDEALQDIAALLGMQVAELDSVATFFNLIYRRPVGRHVIHICESVSCWMQGFDAVRQHLRERLEIDYGGTTADGRYTLLPIVCLGACDRAPALMIDGNLHDAVTPEYLAALLERYR